MRSEGGTRGVLARAGFSVVDELDLEPLRGPSERRYPARWVLTDEDGRAGYVVTGSLYVRGDVIETVDGTSLVDLRGPSFSSDRFEEIVRRRGLAPRPFVSNADVVDLYERAGERRIELAKALTSVEAGDLVACLHRPENAGPESHARVLEVLRDLDSGVPLEWLARHLAAGVGA